MFLYQIQCLYFTGNYGMKGNIYLMNMGEMCRKAERVCFSKLLVLLKMKATGT